MDWSLRDRKKLAELGQVARSRALKTQGISLVSFLIDYFQQRPGSRVRVQGKSTVTETRPRQTVCPSGAGQGKGDLPKTGVKCVLKPCAQKQQEG